MAGRTTFKRRKSLLALGHLKKVDPQGARAWLQGKLFVAILIETWAVTRGSAPFEKPPAAAPQNRRARLEARTALLQPFFLSTALFLTALKAGSSFVFSAPFGSRRRSFQLAIVSSGCRDYPWRGRKKSPQGALDGIAPFGQAHFRRQVKTEETA